MLARRPIAAPRLAAASARPHHAPARAASRPPPPPSPQQQQQQQQQQGRQPGTPSAPELAPYTVVSTRPAYELRLYEPFAVVQTRYSRREHAYLALGSYADGANADGAAFGVTQPIVMRHQPDGVKLMQMMVGTRKGPAQAQQQQQQQPGSLLASLPAPSDASVHLSVAGGELVAVLQFSGLITPEAAAAARQQLLAALQADGLSLAADEAGGMYRVAQYGTVYSLQQRLNELMLAVQV